MHSESTAEGRTYPMPRSEIPDKRFTVGLVLDIAKVLEAHGYPPITNSADLVGLQQQLFQFLYTNRDDVGNQPV